MADQNNTQINNTQQPQQPQNYYVVNMSTAPYAAYPTLANSQVPVYPNPVPQQYYVPTASAQQSPQMIPHQPQMIQQPQVMQSMPQQPQLMQTMPQQPSYYVPQPGSAMYYYDPASATVPMEYSVNDTSHSPLLIGLPVKERLYLREYEVKCGQWLEESWELFKQHWLILIFYSILYFGIQFLPYYIGYILSFILAPGPFMAAAHYARTRTWCNSHLFHGAYLFFPLFAIYFLYGLLVSIGMFLCILPGIYFAVAFSFSAYIYIEFRQEGLRLLDSMSVSHHVITKNFWSVLVFMLWSILICLIGALFFGVGLLVAYPVSAMMSAFAFRDMFGFSEKRTPEKSIVCC